MALTVVKYRKTSGSETLQKNPIIKIGDGSGIVINKIPASIKPAIKRSAPSDSPTTFKSPKISLQTIASTGTPITSLHSNVQWPISQIAKSKKSTLSSVIGSLPPNTIIHPAGSSNTSTTRTVLTNGMTVSPVTGPVGTMQVRRPTIFIKREAPSRTMRQMTMDLIEKNPKLHIGLDTNRLQVLKSVISTSTGVPLPDCYLTLRKLRQNEDSAVLAELFEVSEEEVQKTVARSITAMARSMRGMIRWPSKKHYDRYKDMPFEFRNNLSHVQSLMETVETEMRLQPNNIECQSFKFILCITPNGVITYVSDAYLGKYDDLAIFSAAKFKEVIPKYLSLMVEPGKAIRRRRTTRGSKRKQSDSEGNTGTDSNTDSAEESVDELECEENKANMSSYAAQRLRGELASDQTLSVVDNELRSSKVKDFSIPTMRVSEPICRQRIRDTIDRIREYRILQDCALREPLMFQYLNEIIVVVAALTNILLE